MFIFAVMSLPRLQSSKLKITVTLERRDLYLTTALRCKKKSHTVIIFRRPIIVCCFRTAACEVLEIQRRTWQYTYSCTRKSAPHALRGSHAKHPQEKLSPELPTISALAKFSCFHGKEDKWCHSSPLRAYQL